MDFTLESTELKSHQRKSTQNFSSRLFGSMPMKTNDYNTLEADIKEKQKRSICTKSCLICCLLLCCCIISLLLGLFLWQYLLTQSNICLDPNCVKASSNILEKLNISMSPCDNFYHFACDGWLKNLEVPKGSAIYGMISATHRITRILLKKALNAPGDMYNGKSSTAVRKAKQYYSDCMNVSTIREKGKEPALKYIKDIGNWTISPNSNGVFWNNESWSFFKALVTAHSYGNSPLFSMDVTIDDKNSSVHIISFYQDGLTLSSDEHYNSKKFIKLKKAFIDFGKAFGLLLGGNTTTVEKFEELWKFESKLAKAFTPKEKLVNPATKYHKMQLSEFQTILGDWINMTEFLTEQFGFVIKPTEPVIVYTPRYFEKLGGILKSASRELLANYIVWNGINVLTGYLPPKFTNLVLILLKAIEGISELKPRWKRCVEKTDSMFGYVTSALFIKDFPNSIKTEVDTILENIKKSFISYLPSLSWMDEITKKKAISKANKLKKLIGYPEWIKDPKKLDDFYKNLTVKEGEFFETELQYMLYDRKDSLKYLRKPVDLFKWDMNPTEANAYYSSNNVAVFPAGLLGKPMYSPYLPMSFKFGTVGSIIGHEFTHGFDNKGRLYDENGNLNNWWTNSSSRGFKEKSQCMIDQYSNYTVDGNKVNGLYTLAENIADNGGLKLAYLAFMKWKKSNPHVPAYPGLNFSDEQLFFLGFAQNWCTYVKKSYALNALYTDEHSPAYYRVIGSISNMKAFSSAYGCAKNSPMNTDIKCSVW